jgi:hypothetical protein
MIEAEHATRQRSRTDAINALLRIEYCPDEVDRDALVCVVEDMMDEVCERLGLKQKIVVHATILVEEANAPWVPGRHGFCIAKREFAKVCLPANLVNDTNELCAAFRHEFAHALAIQETERTCQRWLDEAIAMQMGEGPSDEGERMFRHDASQWKDARAVSKILGASRQTRDEQRLVWIAYQQAALIAQFLVSLGSEQMLGKILSEHKLNVLDRFLQQLTGTVETDRALLKVARLTVNEVFEQAYSTMSR